jgi:hypothetical protein
MEKQIEGAACDFNILGLLAAKGLTKSKMVSL